MNKAMNKAEGNRQKAGGRRLGIAPWLLPFELGLAFFLPFAFCLLFAAFSCVQPGAVKAPVAVNAPIASPPILSGNAVATSMPVEVTGTITAKLDNSPVASGNVGVKVERTNSPTSMPVTVDQKQASGPQTGSGSGTVVNVGPVRIDGLVLVLVAALAVVALWLWKRGGAWKKTVDVLVADNAKTGLTQEDKNKITLAAANKGVAELLDSRVQKMKKGKSH